MLLLSFTGFDQSRSSAARFAVMQRAQAGKSRGESYEPPWHLDCRSQDRLAAPARIDSNFGPHQVLAKMDSYMRATIN
jgi:hypothetical protein